jgi:hypothetical protein
MVFAAASATYSAAAGTHALVSTAAVAAESGNHTSCQSPHRTTRPNTATPTTTAAPYRHTCGVWSRQVSCSAGARLVRAVRPGDDLESGRDETDVDVFVDVFWRDPGWSRQRVMVSVRVMGHGEPGFGPRVDEVAAARCSGAWAYLRHAAAAGDMKPCGHDHRELTHLARPHRVVGHADAASCPVAVARSHAASLARQRISPSRSP